MNINFRPIIKNDFPLLKKIYRSTREEELKEIGWTETEKEKFIDFQFSAQHSHYTQAYKGAEFKLIVWNKLEVGRLYIWETENQIRIIDIAILEKHRGKSIGNKILTDLIEESKKTEKKLNLHVEQYNNRALRFYERLGFKKMDDKGAYYFMERLPDENI